MRKRFLISIMMVITLVVSFALWPKEVKADTNHTHDNITFTAWTSSNSLPTSGSYYLTSDVTISSTCNVSGTLNLCLNGHSITKTGNTGCVFYVNGSNKIFNLYECDNTEHFYYINSDYLGVVVNSLEAAQAGNPERYGSFTGGYITGGRGNYIDSHYRGGCMVVSNGAKFNFYGGTIIGNCPKIGDNGGSHGAIWLRFGDATIHDGAYIIGNCAPNPGAIGANYQQGTGGTLIMDGGVIADNTSKSSGGGIDAGCPTTITGGRFFRNVALNGYGGGIAVTTDPGKVHIGGNVEITENRASHFGGGVCVFGVDFGWTITSGSLSISGSPKIYDNYAKQTAADYVSDNLYVMVEKNSYYTNKTHLVLDGALENDTNIGVNSDNNEAIIIPNWTTYMNNAEPSNYFFGDDDLYGTYLEDGKVVLKLIPHVHNDVTYSAWTASDSLPTEAGNYYLTSDVTLSSTWNLPSGTTNLDLNGHGILMTGSGDIIHASGSKTLNIVNCNTKREHYITLENYRGISVSDSGEESYSDGNGVVKVTGAYLTGGTGYESNRGGVLFINNGGKVSISDVNLIGNISNNWGGAACIGTSDSSDISSLTLNNCLVTKNHAVEGSAFRLDHGRMILNNTIITDNHDTATPNGGAFSAYWVSKIIVSGNTQIYGNYNNDNEVNINLGGPINFNGRFAGIEATDLAPTAHIGISMNTEGAFNNNWTTTMGTADPTEYFFSDSDNACIKLNNNNEVVLESYRFVTYNGNGSTGGSVPVDNNKYLSGNEVEVFDKPSDLVKTGSTFIGWNTKADGTGTTYSAGAKFSISEDTTLYAMWGQCELVVRITNITKSSTNPNIYLNFSNMVISSKSITSIGGSVSIPFSSTATSFSCTINVKTNNNDTVSKAATGTIGLGKSISINVPFGPPNGPLQAYMTIYYDAYFVNPIAPTVSVEEWSYGDTPNTPTVTGNTGNGAVTYLYKLSTDPDSSFSTTVPTEPGVYTVRANIAATTYYKAGSSATNFTIHKREVIVKAKDTSITYGDLPTNNGIEYSGFVNSEDEQYIIGNLEIAYDYEQFDDAGAYKIISGGLSIANNNYVLKFVDGVLTVNPKEIGLDWTNLTLTYNGLENKPTATATGLINDDECEVTVSGATNAGEHVATATSLSSSNYKLPENVTQEFEIVPLQVRITITGNNNTCDYDGEEHQISGYVAVADSELYDVENDLTFSGETAIKRTDAGITCMGLTHNMFANTNSNFDVVLFDVIDGYQQINRINIVVTITGNNNICDYDGEEHQVSGFVVASSNDLYDVENDFTFTGEAQAKRTNAGTTFMGLTPNMFVNNNDNFGLVIFNVVDGYQLIRKINATVTITGNNHVTDYDGQEHQVSGFVVASSNDLYDVENDLVFNGEAKAKRTNAGTTNMGLTANMFVNENPNFAIVIFNVYDGYQTVNKINATVTITGNSSTVDYDGTEHTVSGYVAQASTNLYDVTKAFEFSGEAQVKQTNAGTTNMGLTADMFSNIDDNFNEVTFIVTDGYQTINKINATVTITGNSSTVDYDGQEHTVTGYVAVPSTNLYDVTKAFTFSGEAQAKQTNAGTTNMGLTADMFSNIDDNFNEVTFIVTDGYQTVNKINATVTITGNNSIVDYDGTEHQVSGYEAQASTNLYDVTKAFEFSGNALAKRTNAGTSNMGLTANMFSNIDDNFNIVTFNVTDGYQTINKINATVTITGNNSTVDYDSLEHTITGYVAVPSTNLYDVTKAFTFSGEAQAKRTNAGTSNMGLTANMFSNIDDNFNIVTFVVTDGYQTINKINATVTITGNNSTVDYDSLEHTITGYVAVPSTNLYDVTKAFTFSGEAQAKQTNAGTTNMGLTADMFSNIDDNFNIVTFVVTDGYQKVDPAKVTVNIYGSQKTLDYNGKVQFVSGYSAVADHELYDLKSDYDFIGGDSTSRMIVGTSDMNLMAKSFTNINPNFEVTFVITDGYITISPIDVTVTITGNNNTCDYDGQEHQVTGYEVEASTDLFDVNKDITFNGEAQAKQTNAGSSYMGLSADMFSNNNDNFGNVTFIINDGYQTINPIDVTIKITGNNNTCDYDGQEHQVEGFEAEASTDLFDVTKDITFNGEALAKQTNAGSSYMGLIVDMFSSDNANFKEVTFNVTDGYQTINPINVTVTITGNNNTCDYDGQEHQVEGFEAEASTDLFDVTKDITFNGEAVAKQTNAGTANMGLTADMFSSDNANFKEVTFDVTDGYQTINPIDVTITITGNNNTCDYDGQEHQVEGFEAEASTDLFDVTKDITFNGEALAKQTNAGSSYMGLTVDMFSSDNANFKEVTFNVTDGYQTINPINVTVTITGNNNTCDYDGQEHQVTGYEVEASTDLFDITKDLTFNGEALAKQTNAGTANMGLTVDMFSSDNANFKEVTFNVTDGYQTINKINATVTITGNNNTADYDGTEHQVIGYEAETDNDLYDVTKDFAFNGEAVAKQTNAGSSYMGLTSDMFSNNNDNFGNVTFIINDGYQTIEPVDSIITVAPTAYELTYSGEAQQLVSRGEAQFGDMLYALGKNDTKVPSASSFNSQIPTGTEAGTYFVWYMVKGDDNHNDLDAKVVKVLIIEENWNSLFGILYQNDGITPIENAKVIISKGNEVIDYVFTNENGRFEFIIANGVYNIVAEYEDRTDTKLVVVSESTEQNIVLPDGKTESILEVNTEDEESFEVVVGGLDQEAQDIRKDEDVSQDSNVSVIMTVEPKTEETAQNAHKIIELATDKNLGFFEITIEKVVDSLKTTIDVTKNVLEIVVPYQVNSRKDIKVYSYHGSEVIEFVENNTKANGTFQIDYVNELIHIYSNSFSTYAIGYTPYYNLNGSMKLGSYAGSANVEIVNQTDGTIYKFENVNVGNISFDGIPKGNYIMTITWTDGATNTLSIPMTIGNKNKVENENTKEDVALEEETEDLSANQVDNIFKNLSGKKLRQNMQQNKRQLHNLIQKHISVKNIFNAAISVADIENGFANKYDNPVNFDDGYIRKKKEK